MIRTLVGVDTGGTFTDFLVVSPRGVEAFKVPSTPRDPSQAFALGLDEARRRLGGEPDHVAHGFTVATNTLLTRSGARAAFVTTEGFEDLLLIGRQTRPDLYALAPKAPTPLVARNRTLGARERLGPDGGVETPLTAAEANRVARAVARLRPQAVAVCLLHSYARADHEKALARALRKALPNTPISLSHEISGEYREFERASTTVLNAYLAPRISDYLARLERAAGKRLRVLQSNGGTVSASALASRPVLSVLSGPAGGVLGAARLASRVGLTNVLTLDVGGTSTDVAVHPGRPRVTKEAVLDGVPIRVPMLEVETVGAGGGSLARVDAGGALAVGPESAGADPGPACYGKGGGPTVTDAHVVLGRIVPELFLDGALALDVDASWTALEGLAKNLGFRGADAARRAARGVVAVANTSIERALRVISVARGHDPRGFALVAFGGAGPLHAAELALGLGVNEILVPPRAGLLSAWGLLGAEETHPLSRTVLWSLDESARLRKAFVALERESARRFGRGLGFRKSLDLRYRGQSFEIEIPLSANLARDFHAAHNQRYGYARPGRAIEIVNLNLEAHRPGPKLPEPKARRLPRPKPWGTIALDTGTRVAKSPVWRRESLGVHSRVSGPCLIVEYGATTYVPPRFTAQIDARDNLRVRKP